MYFIVYFWFREESYDLDNKNNDLEDNESDEGESMTFSYTSSMNHVSEDKDKDKNSKQIKALNKADKDFSNLVRRSKVG